MNACFPQCQLCEGAPASCKSHIIPRQFYKRIRGGAKHLFEAHVGEEIVKRFTQSGIWQQGILCPKCDEKLGIFDEYAYEILPENIDPNRIKHLGPGARAYDLGLIEVSKFRQFLVALVWRASRSTHDMFRFLKIGHHDGRFKDILTGKNMSSLGSVDCVFVLLPPFPNTCGAASVIQFYLYPWKLLIRLDDPPFDPIFEQTALKAGVSTYALMMTTYSRGELRLLADFQRKVKQHESKRVSQKP